MHRVHKFKIFIMIVLVLLLMSAHFKFIYGYLYNAFYDKDDLRIYLSLINTKIHTVSAEPSNRVYLKVEVKDLNGQPVPNIQVNFGNSQNIGQIYPSSSSTNIQGESIAIYTPPNYYELFANGPSVDITSSIVGTNKNSLLKISLVPVPVVFVHGYQENPHMFDNLNEFLSSKGYDCSALSYDSTLGVDYASKELEQFLLEQKKDLLSRGILVNKFDLITHSMGGLVARYYSGSESYIKTSDINKVIFLSVPHKGSYMASIGEEYFNDQSIKDLVPDNELFTKTFHEMINSGLNSSIQTGNLLSQYDEVVTIESAGLDEWGIKTEIFKVGENNFTVDSFLSGDILYAPNHKGILNNKRVFDRIYEMLNVDLPYPAVLNK